MSILDNECLLDYTDIFEYPIRDSALSVIPDDPICSKISSEM